MFTSMIAAGMALSTFFAPATGEFKNPPSDEIVIDVATVNGSGCPEGTAEVSVSPDNKAFTVTYSDYLAEVGPDSDPTAFRKNCQLNLVVHVPQGFTYGIARADYRGFAHLAEGATGTQKASYYFQGDSETTHTSTTFEGAYSDNWQVTDETDIADIVYKPCGVQRNFNINTELRVDAGSSDSEETSFMTMDSTDGSIKTTYHFSWKKCES
ncbi:DUF4360 domain-containing protein [Actinopolyspora mortivallis]|uniref:DUF4360 domain-containing protein n=1 Tax=Actinopolyspora mortivallis TaxID=33906 RepID=A0A2T0H1Z4_ACTMO|nr:DUF4360 domain-containing protein [Actinopolyspora mortivallis]PRW65376.1 DUF4360 domain-containing protein [Actinopolyspora mortivallis]